MKFWFDTFRSRLLLTFVTYALYMLLYIATDGQSREFYSGGNPLSVYLLDVAVTLVCIFLFVQLSIFYSRIVYSRFVFTARPYVSLMAYSLILLLLNNAMAYLLSFVTGWLFEMDNLPFLQVQHIYVYAIQTAFYNVLNIRLLCSRLLAAPQKAFYQCLSWCFYSCRSSLKNQYIAAFFLAVSFFSLIFDNPNTHIHIMSSKLCGCPHACIHTLMATYAAAARQWNGRPAY